MYQQPMQMQMQPQQVVIVQQQAPPQKGYYKQLCDCCSDCGVCLIVNFCPLIGYILHAQAVQKATNGGTNCCVACCLDYIGCCCINRGKIRAAYQIPGDAFSDFCIFYFCACCAVIQDINEVNYREANNLK